MADKIYVGNGKSKFDGQQVAVSLCLTDLPKEHVFEYDGKKYIKLVVQERREADDYGRTHYVAVDTWKPEEKKAESKKEEADLPF
tara:strand:- start:825 stop:1079 length:255 start_codon:yes stop_codon:yes gene_type:complete